MKFIAAVKNVQKKFLKYSYFNKHEIYLVRGNSYETLLREFDMIAIKNIENMSSFNKIVHGQIDSTILLSQILFNIPHISSTFVELFNVSVPNTVHHLHSAIINMYK